MPFSVGDRVTRGVAPRHGRNRGTITRVEDHDYVWIRWDEESDAFRYFLQPLRDYIQPLSVVDRLAELAESDL